MRSPTDPERSPIPRKGIRRPRRRRRHGPLSRTLARWAFHSHLWVGVAATALVALIAVTGILLNHKGTLGLMPQVEHAPAAPLTEALPLSELVRRAGEAVSGEVSHAGVDRMDVRPSDGVVKVRFDDRGVTEVTLDLASGDVLRVGERNDVFLERLHSGEVFGDRGILLSDLAAAGLLLLLVSGWWMWLYPRSRM